MLRLAAFAALAFVLSPITASARVLATCGASSGQAHWDDVAPWIADGIKGGKIQFEAPEGGSEVRVTFIDVTGVIRNVADQGAKVTIAFATKEQFGIVVVYEDVALIETYTVFKSSDSSRRLQWTSNRGSTSGVPKVASFIASCL